MPRDMATTGWLDRIRSRCRPEGAQTMAEYAVILGVITPVIIIGYTLFADKIAALLDSVRSLL